jgi:hypothetical protein
MTRRLFAWLLLACCAVAHAQSDTGAAPAKDRYLEALQMLSEGRQQEAQRLLETLIETAPNHAGARLELAIMHCSLGHAAEAERQFKEIEDSFQPSAGIREIINAHRKQGCLGWQPQQLRIVTLSRGADSNVNQGASSPWLVIGSGPDQVEQQLTDDYLPKADQFTQLSLDFTREVDPKGTLLVAQARLRRHDSLHEQDSQALLFGLERPWAVGDAIVRGGANVSLVGLGGKLYQRQSQLQVRVLAPTLVPESMDLALTGALSHIAYVHRGSFNSDMGDLGVAMGWRGAHTQLAGSFGVQADYGPASRLGGDRHGRYLAAQWKQQLGDRYAFEAGFARQLWRGTTPYSPGLIDAVRSQNMRQVRSAVSYAFSPHQSVQLEWRRVKNNENISLFKYNSQLFQLNWRWQDF